MEPATATLENGSRFEDRVWCALGVSVARSDTVLNEAAGFSEETGHFRVGDWPGKLDPVRDAPHIGKCLAGFKEFSFSGPISPPAPPPTTSAGRARA